MGKLLFILLLLSTETPRETYTPEDKTEVITARVDNFLPIGWGTIYRCTPIKESPISFKSNQFNMYTSVGFSKFHPSRTFALNDTVQFRLIRTERFVDTNFSKSPSQSGLVDKDLRIWSLIAIE